MTELQAALANVGLERFPEQARQREEMATYMDEALSEVPGIRVLRPDPRHTSRSFYLYGFGIDPEVFGVENDAVCYALEKEGIPCDTGYPAMNRYKLFQPQNSKLPVPSAFPDRFRFDELQFPVAERAAEKESVWLAESVFRAGRQGIDDAVAAIRKVQANGVELAARVAEIRASLDQE
jgi:dTDP-4-amino-4,6-dideoxygalactose transaminase